MSKRVLVYGAGVIGSIYATRLAKAGHSVTILARGKRLESLRRAGLRIRNVFIGEEETAEVRIVEDLDPAASFDLAVVALRSGQVLGALRSLGAMPGMAAVLAVGNNLEDLDRESAAAGPRRLVLGFGAFGGYREGDTIAYLDGRTKEKPSLEAVSPTTLGLVSKEARPALESAKAILASAGLRCSESPDIASWLLCHAALVFPLAGAMYAAGGDQARFCGTPDAILLGIRACKEAMRALLDTGCGLEPRSLGRLLAMPEWLLAPLLKRRFAGEGARVALFGHANAPGGREEIGGQAAILDARLKKSRRPTASWDRLLPWFDPGAAPRPLPEGSRELRFRIW